MPDTRPKENWKVDDSGNTIVYSTDKQSRLVHLAFEDTFWYGATRGGALYQVDAATLMQPNYWSLRVAYVGVQYFRAPEGNPLHEKLGVLE